MDLHYKQAMADERTDWAKVTVRNDGGGEGGWGSKHHLRIPAMSLPLEAVPFISEVSKFMDTLSPPSLFLFGAD